MRRMMIAQLAMVFGLFAVMAAHAEEPPMEKRYFEGSEGEAPSTPTKDSGASRYENWPGYNRPTTEELELKYGSKTRYLVDGYGNKYADMPTDDAGKGRYIDDLKQQIMDGFKNLPR